MCDGAQWPKAWVGEAEVITLFFTLGQPHPAQRVFGIIGRDPQMTVGIDGFLVRVATTMRYPFSIASAQNRFQSSDESAGRNHNFERLALPCVGIRLAVGNNDKAARADFAAHVD